MSLATPQQQPDSQRMLRGLPRSSLRRQGRSPPTLQPEPRPMQQGLRLRLPALRHWQRPIQILHRQQPSVLPLRLWQRLLQQQLRYRLPPQQRLWLLERRYLQLLPQRQLQQCQRQRLRQLHLQPRPIPMLLSLPHQLCSQPLQRTLPPQRCPLLHLLQLLHLQPHLLLLPRSLLLLLLPRCPPALHLQPPTLRRLPLGFWPLSRPAWLSQHFA
mmetsp:Transcript_67198/g.160988  ORF Transcript_67198/g.160988 Transcript_67198/m.160988 type:complete len:214 (+) Transcript_67198:1380-2021(+)